MSKLRKLIARSESKTGCMRITFVMRTTSGLTRRMATAVTADSESGNRRKCEKMNWIFLYIDFLKEFE